MSAHYQRMQYFPSISSSQKSIDADSFNLFCYLQSYIEMDYFGHNQYFSKHYDNSDDQSVQICTVNQYGEQFCRFDDPLLHQKMPDLDQSPFNQDKKQTLTQEATQETQNQKKVQIEKKTEVKTGIVFQQKAIDKYREVYRGTKDDTVQLNINFKTLIVHYFKQLKILKELNEYEIKHVNEFSERVPSFNSLMIFFEKTEENKGIREKSLELFSSPQCVKRILTGRSKIKTKLQMIKFIEKVRFNILTEGKGYKWKDNIKKEIKKVL